MTDALHEVVEKLTLTTEKISHTLTELVATKQQKDNNMPTPKTELVNNKWTIEHYNKKEMIELGDTEQKQAVYVYNCKHVTISIPSKVTAITMDSCEQGQPAWIEPFPHTNILHSHSL